MNVEYARDLYDRTQMATKDLLKYEDIAFDRTITQLLDFQTTDRTRSEIITHISQLLSVVYGVTMVIVGGDE